MALLDSIAGPADLRDLTDEQLDELAGEIRTRLIEAVARHGGHLGPNLGVVELTMALHRVFESPRDRIVWDTGHQSYVHKMLTGRAAEFDRLRQAGGLSGYPCQAESEHDWVENSHASTSLSYADGMAKANQLRGVDASVVAVIGDGAMTGGMAWEALNNIAAGDRPVVIVVNDNGRSYTPTVGGLANRLTDIRTNPRYESTLHAIKERLNRRPGLGPVTYDALHAMKKGIKDALAPQGMFEDLGLKYIGPVDGHDRSTLEHALTQAKRFGGPVLVHVITVKGQGYDIAVANENDQMHQSAPFDPETGDATNVAPAGWTSVFRDEVVRIADARPDVVGVTAAMLYPTGLDAFADKFPDRVFDVGIAEQHAVTSAAGMAMAGLHPVVAIYATFMNRAFDQVLLDVAMHRQGVTFVLDRAGITGDDGASHNGMWDMSVFQVVPNLRIAAPRDGSRLRELLREAVDVDDAPTIVRFAKGAVPADVPGIERIGTGEILSQDAKADVFVLAVGALAGVANAAADLIREAGHGVTVVDPRWVKPIDPAIVDLAARHGLAVSVEDNGRQGGIGSTFARELQDRGYTGPVQVHGIDQQFLTHAKRDAVLADQGLSADRIAEAALEHLAGRKR
ncbi:MAG TPA: 1-deoxy-D-xylulose-5-phosphate synthase [Aeromicrobium sp.]|nr:1-deoxy-D-xylulose-5-phosphate synthase [Aeromicrobium sp.]